MFLKNMIYVAVPLEPYMIYWLSPGKNVVKGLMVFGH